MNLLTRCSSALSFILPSGRRSHVRFSTNAPRRPTFTATVTAGEWTPSGCAASIIPPEAAEPQTVSIDGAVPGETVDILVNRSVGRRPADALQVHNASEDRVRPFCAHFGYCGGCQLQYVKPERQLQLKEDYVRQQNLATPPPVLLPSIFPSSEKQTGYRRRGRLLVTWKSNKQRAVVGWRERCSSAFAANLTSCPILDERVGSMSFLTQLSLLATSLSIRENITEFEVVVGDNATAVVLCHARSVELSADDHILCTAFARQQHVRMYSQSSGSNVFVPISFEGDRPRSHDTLTYSVHLKNTPSSLTFQFQLGDFCPINTQMNESLVQEVVKQLAPTPRDVIVDFFCGVGTLTLAIAASQPACKVIGVDRHSIALAERNANQNQLSHVTFWKADLMEPKIFPVFSRVLSAERPTKFVIDPDNRGAEILMSSRVMLPPSLTKVLYISRTEKHLARDAEILLHKHQFRLKSTRLFDFAPHSNHFTMLSVFERPKVHRVVRTE